METIGLEALLAGGISTLMAPLNKRFSGKPWWETVAAYVCPALGVAGAFALPHLAGEPSIVVALRGVMLGAAAMGGHAAYKKAKGA